MPGKRPPIPAEVQCEVFIEAGHRCAVYGETSALWAQLAGDESPSE
jgi:hypothetical protein